MQKRKLQESELVTFLHSALLFFMYGTLCTRHYCISRVFAAGFCTNLPNGNYAKSSCNPQYIRCWNGAVEELTCPDRLFFNPDTSSCTTLDQIKSCGGGITPPTPSICDGVQNGDSVEVNPCSNVYVECWNGRENIQRCSAGLVYSGLHGKCVLPQEDPRCAPEPTKTTAPPGNCLITLALSVYFRSTCL